MFSLVTIVGMEFWFTCTTYQSIGDESIGVVG